MDVNELDAAYADLIAAAEMINDTTALTGDARSAVDWTLTHIALSDRILASAAREGVSGLPVTIDNRAAMDENAVALLLARTTHTQRVELVGRNAAEFSAALKALPEHAAETRVRLRLVNRDGQPLPGQDVTWSDLIRVRADRHIPGHAARLRALASVS
jgi:hypothetical protein